MDNQPSSSSNHVREKRKLAFGPQNDLKLNSAKGLHNFGQDNYGPNLAMV